MAFRSAHQKAYTEYFQRCNAIVPSQTTSYDVDKNNIEYAKNLAKVCLLAANQTVNSNTVKLLANNIPIELMPKAIKMLKDTQSVTQDEINSVIVRLNNQDFNVNLQMDDLQSRIDSSN